MNSESKTKYSDVELEEFMVIVESKLKEAKEQFEILQSQITSLAESPEAKIKGLDDGVPTADAEQLSSMALRTQKHIQHLENAKLRIINKTYGYCRETGKLISKERLRAVPHATLSIEAKQK